MRWTVSATATMMHNLQTASPTPTSANSVFAYPHGMLTRASPSRRIRINISGHYFETSIQQLENHPETLLGDSNRRRKHYDRSRDEFFFDRHRPSFEAIFEYYQTGARLKRPPNVLTMSSWPSWNFYQLEKQAVENYRQAEGYTTEEVVLPADQTQRRVWLLFENPETSRCAYAMAIISVIVTLVSIILFCVETLPVVCDDSLHEGRPAELPSTRFSSSSPSARPGSPWKRSFALQSAQTNSPTGRTSKTSSTSRLSFLTT